MKRIFLLVSSMTLVLAGCGDNPGPSFCERFPDDALCHDSSVTTGGGGCQSAEDCPEGSYCDQQSGACRPLSGNVCDQAMQIVVAGFDQGCAGRNDCCFCHCWNSGHQQPDTTDPCTCGPLDPDGDPCEGEKLTQAQQCVQQADLCRQEAVDLIYQYLCAPAESP